MISFLLGSVQAHPTRRYVQDGTRGEDVTRRCLAQQPDPTVGKGRHAAGSSLLTGEASPLQSWGPRCCQQRPQTAEISCGQRDCRQQQSQPPQSQHKQGNAQGEETEVQDRGI